MYFSGINTKVLIESPVQTIKLDIVEIQFSINQSASPIYTPGSREYAAAMQGSVSIQGTLALNFSLDQQPLINILLENEYDLKIISEDTIFERDLIEDQERHLDADVITNSFYSPISEKESIKINNVNFISHTHGIYPSAENLTDVFQFLAGSIEYI